MGGSPIHPYRVKCVRANSLGEIMSVDQMEDGRVVHYPKRRDVFVFDDEVSRIFPETSKRYV